MEHKNRKIRMILKQLACMPLVLLYLYGTGFAMLEKTFPEKDFSGHIRMAIKTRIETRIAEKRFICRGERLWGVERIPSFYRERDFMPLWFNSPEDVDAAKELATAIFNAADDGLSPREYHFPVINDLLNAVNTSHGRNVGPELWADLDLILTDAFLLYGAHLSAGRVNPENIHEDQVVTLPEISLVESLKKATRSGNIKEELAVLRPSHNGYLHLQNALKRLKITAVKGGWPRISGKDKMRVKEKSLQVELLRTRLRISRDLMEKIPEDPAFFDKELENAVRRFQKRNGLKPDGIVGKNTRAMLNKSVDERIGQVEINLERWRWLPHDPGFRHIMVNTADFSLKMIENNRTVLAMRVVVGRPARRSPVFSSHMSYLVANPYWNVPTSIAVKDILPRLNKGVSYLGDQVIRVFKGWKEDSPEIDPATVSWSEYGENRFPFRLRQDPGPKNALGRIKFMFPNKFAVYLHDTPNRSLFENIRRGFSSGCIRVEKPIELARRILRKDKEWVAEKLMPMIEAGDRKVIRVKDTVKVHLMYMTAWVDESGRLQFREDIYKRDQILGNALVKRSPGPAPAFHPHLTGKLHPLVSEKAQATP